MGAAPLSEHQQEETGTIGLFFFGVAVMLVCLWGNRSRKRPLANDKQILGK